jgi:hypothetical protein
MLDGRDIFTARKLTEIQHPVLRRQEHLIETGGIGMLIFV